MKMQQAFCNIAASCRRPLQQVPLMFFNSRGSQQSPTLMFTGGEPVFDECIGPPQQSPAWKRTICFLFSPGCRKRLPSSSTQPPPGERCTAGSINIFPDGCQIFLPTNRDGRRTLSPQHKTTVPGADGSQRRAVTDSPWARIFVAAYGRNRIQRLPSAHISVWKRCAAMNEWIIPIGFYAAAEAGRDREFQPA